MILLEGSDGATIGCTTHSTGGQPSILLVITKPSGSALRCQLSGENARLLAASLSRDADYLSPLEKLWAAETDSRIMDPEEE